MDTAGVKVLETAEDIQERRQQVLDRYRRFKELSIMRRQKLEDSHRFQSFRRDADELEKWILEKLQIASDENYKDPSNLQVCFCTVLHFTVRPLHIHGRISGIEMVNLPIMASLHRVNCRNIRPLRLKCRLTPGTLSI